MPRRTHCRNVAEEIAQALAMNYVFGCEFEEMTERHNGMPAYHGQATLSRFPLLNSRILKFHRQSKFWLPRWFIPRMRPFQRRLGGRIALISYVDLPERKLMVYNAHLESKGNDGLRCSQLEELLDDVSQHRYRHSGSCCRRLQRRSAPGTRRFSHRQNRAQQSIRSQLDCFDYCTVSFQRLPCDRLGPDERTAHCF